jgi:hypothetical protein
MKIALMSTAVCLAFIGAAVSDVSQTPLEKAIQEKKAELKPTETEVSHSPIIVEEPIDSFGKYEVEYDVVEGMMHKKQHVKKKLEGRDLADLKRKFDQETPLTEGKIQGLKFKKIAGAD